jgi:hypothetical protein
MNNGKPNAIKIWMNLMNGGRGKKEKLQMF